MTMEQAGHQDAKGKILPPGWRWVRLGEVSEFAYGENLPAHSRDSQGEVPVYGSNGIVGQHIRSVTKGPTIVIGRKGSIGEVHFSSVPCWPIDTTYYIEHTKLECDLVWLSNWLKALDLSSMNKAAAIPGLNRDDVYRLEIPFPPLAEQKRIAAVLNQQMTAVEKARAGAEAQLEAAKALSAAYLREVFPQLGQELPPGWQWVRLGEGADLLPSKSIASDGDTEVHAITTASLTELGFNPGGVKQARMWSKDVQLCIVSAGEVLIARSNTPELVGRVAMFEGIPPGAVASDLTIRVRTHGSLSPGYLTGFLSSLFVRGYWKDNAGGASGSMKKITRTQVESLSVPLPSLAEQKRIAALLIEKMASVEKVYTALEAQLNEIGALPAVLLRQAFAGET